MTARLTLLCHAMTTAMHRGAFPDDDEATANGLAAAAALAGRQPPVSRVLRSPERCAAQTVSALGLVAEEEATLRGCDFGRWRGRTLAEVADTEPGLVEAWLADPEVAPHGGESLSSLVRRVGAWLDAGTVTGRVLIVTHPEVLRAAVVHVLGAPPAALRHVDVEPLSAIQLTSDGRRWSLRFGAGLLRSRM